MISAQRRGVSYDMIQRMTLGQLVDYCTEYDNQEKKANQKADKPTRKRASQADIDAFFGGRKTQNGG